MSQIVPLEVLGENESGRIVEILGPEAWRHRLDELGLREGCLVRLIKRGQPCLIAIDGQRLSFRSDPAAMILVEALVQSAT